MHAIWLTVRWIVTQAFQDPATCSDGYSYERAAVEDWLKNHDMSFMTGELLPDKFVVHNRSLKSSLEDLTIYIVWQLYVTLASEVKIIAHRSWSCT